MKLKESIGLKRKIYVLTVSYSHDAGVDEIKAFSSRKKAEDWQAAWRRKPLDAYGGDVCDIEEIEIDED